MRKISLLLMILAIFFARFLRSYETILEAQVVCLKTDEKLEPLKFDFVKTSVPIVEDRACFVLTFYPKVPAEKKQAVRQASTIMLKKIVGDKK